MGRKPSGSTDPRTADRAPGCPGRPRRTGLRPLLAGLLLALVAAPAAACSSAPPATDSRAGSSAQVRSAEQAILDTRARAVRTKDVDLFLRHVTPSDRALMASQRRYFDNLVQLPWQTLRWQLLDGTWKTPAAVRPGWGEQVHQPRIRLSAQLAEYDSAPVHRVVGLAFGRRAGKTWIVADTAEDGSLLTEGTPDPWELTAIHVVSARGVLGVFDDGTRRTANQVTGVVRRGIAQVNKALPFRWSNHVVVYSFSDASVLGSFADVPGGNIRHLGAMTFPVYATGGHRRQVATRFMLMADSVAAGEPFLGRITRHELSHVAIGTRDDGAPVWLSEGLGEYLGAREVPQERRIIPTSALPRARGPVSGMPVSASFNGADQEWHYALSWMACDYIADRFGEPRLWQLMTALHADGAGTRDSAQDVVLRRVLGIDSAELARRGAARIRQIYG